MFENLTYLPSLISNQQIHNGFGMADGGGLAEIADNL